MPKVGKNQRGDIEKGMVMYYGHCESYLELLVIVCVRYVLGHFGGGKGGGEGEEGGRDDERHMENLSIQAASADLLISVVMGVMSSEEASRFVDFSLSLDIFRFVLYLSLFILIPSFPHLKVCCLTSWSCFNSSFGCLYEGRRRQRGGEGRKGEI